MKWNDNDDTEYDLWDCINHNSRNSGKCGNTSQLAFIIHNIDITTIIIIIIIITAIYFMINAISIIVSSITIMFITSTHTHRHGGRRRATACD